MTAPDFALTLWRPWAGLVAAGVKPVENRTWPPPARVIGQRIAIHAGKRWDHGGAQWAFQTLVTNGAPVVEAMAAALGQARHPEGVVAVATVAGWVFAGNPPRTAIALSATPGVHGITASDPAAPWFVGPVGWVLREVVALPVPVACRGAQGLWRLPPDVRARVEEQIRRAA